ARSIGAPARDLPAEPPSAAPARDAGWIGGDEVSDAPVDSKDETARLRLSDLPLPIAAAARGESDELDMPAEGEAPRPPIELDAERDLPALGSLRGRPPPRRTRPASPAAQATRADLPAELDELRGDGGVDLPAVVAP